MINPSQAQIADIVNNPAAYEHAVNRSYNRAIWIVVAVLVAFVAFQIWFTLHFSRSQPLPPIAKFGEPDMLSGAALCPGETLAFSVRIDVRDLGVVDVDHTIWRFDPLQIMEYSTPRRVVIYDRESVAYLHEWTVPDGPREPGIVPQWSPGHYQLDLAVSTTSRATTPQVIAVPFSIREDCP